MKLDVFIIDGKWKARIADDILPQEWDTEEQAQYGLEDELLARGVVAPVNTVFLVDHHVVRWCHDTVMVKGQVIGRVRWNHLLSRKQNVAIASALVTDWLSKSPGPPQQD